MRLLLVEHFNTAMHSLRTNRMRTTLTTLGIAIGIASVTTILALAQGVTNSVTRQVEDLGGNIAVVRPSTDKSDGLSSNPLAVQRFGVSTLREDDATTIHGVNKSLAVAPIMTFEGTLKSGKDTVHRATIVASTPELAKTADLPVEEGQFIDDNSESTTVTIGQQLAIDLFGEEFPIGSTFTVRGKTFTVIGALKRQNNPVNHNGIDFDRAVIIHFSEGKALNGDRTQIQQINLATPVNEPIGTLTDAVRTALTKAHGEEDFSIVDGSSIASPTNQMFVLLTKIMLAIAAISLVVGGIGIMNIMLVSVAERTREIGIRKSVGASNRTILMQFLTESLLMSVFGGVAGVILGIIVAFSIGSILAFAPVITLAVIAIGIGLSIVVGVGFGMYPAIRAARKNPIDSIRHYR